MAFLVNPEEAGGRDIDVWDKEMTAL